MIKTVSLAIRMHIFVSEIFIRLVMAFFYTRIDR